MKKSLYLIFILFVSLACKKVEGEGGKASISGKIYVKDYNKQQTSLLDEYDGASENVYLIYGTDDTVYDDKMEASYDGTFKFKYLQPGTYTVFSYQEKYNASTGVTTNEAVKVTVELKKNETIDVGTITLKL